MDNTDWKTKYETLVRLLQQDIDPGVYPMGHLTKEVRDKIDADRSDEWRCGWNNAIMAQTDLIGKISEKAEQGMSDEVSMLLASGHAFYDGEHLSLNMNDTWAWALSWCPEVEPEQVKEVARLFSAYGYAGLMYWHSSQENNMRSEFHDNNRAIDFVANEERIRKEVPDYNKRAYHKTSYTVGEAAPAALEIKEEESIWKKISKSFLGKS